MIDTILLSLILLFVFLMWLRGNPQFIELRRKWRIWRREHGHPKP